MSPLQYGFFKGCFVDSPEFPELNRVLWEIGEKYGVPKTAVAIAWILRHPAKMQAIAGTIYVRRQRLSSRTTSGTDSTLPRANIYPKSN